MRTPSSRPFAFVALLMFVAFATSTGCNTGGSATGGAGAVDELARFKAERDSVTRRLAVFDTLDYNVFTNQEWTRLHESHSPDIVVNWPDGHHTNGIERHIEDLKAMFVYAPDTQIKEHPIRFGSGEWTCVTGVMTGTFTKPMPVGGGKLIPPTGKKFSITMCTVGHWKDGVMIEESLFWDNATYMSQLGVKM